MPNVREKIFSHTGEPPLAWWADTSGMCGRIKVCVFGEHGLCFALPTEREDGRRAYLINSYKFAEDSLWKADVDETIASPPSSRPEAQESPRCDSSYVDGPDLRAAVRAMLGNLPQMAQELLLDPFMGGQRIFRAEWYYLGGEFYLDPFTFVIAGENDVTMANGTMKKIVDGRLFRSRWIVTCYRATVAERRGE